MDKLTLIKMFANSQRVKVKYRDSYGFIVWGILLAISADQDEMLIDSYTNSVKVESLINAVSI